MLWLITNNNRCRPYWSLWSLSCFLLCCYLFHTVLPNHALCFVLCKGSMSWQLLSRIILTDKLVSHWNQFPFQYLYTQLCLCTTNHTVLKIKKNEKLVNKACFSMAGEPGAHGENQHKHLKTLSSKRILILTRYSCYKGTVLPLSHHASAFILRRLNLLW